MQGLTPSCCLRCSLQGSLYRSLTRSMHIHAAVDANRLAGHEVAVI